MFDILRAPPDLEAEWAAPRHTMAGDNSVTALVHSNPWSWAPFLWLYTGALGSEVGMEDLVFVL